MSYAERLMSIGPSKYDLAELERAEQDLAGGDKGAILRAVFICANCRMAMPDWLREAFLSAYQEAKKPRAKWDDVFGTPRKKNLKAHQVEVRGRLAPMIWGHDPRSTCKAASHGSFPRRCRPIRG